MRAVRLIRLLVIGLAAAGTGCAARAQPADEDAAARVTALADAYLEAYFDAFPHYATLLGVADAAHDRLPDISAAARQRWQRREEQILAELEAIDPAALPPDHPAAVTHAFLSEILRDDVAFRVCRMWLWNVSPTWTGWQSEMAMVADAQPTATAAAADAAYRRFAALPRYLEQEIANLRDGLAAGYSAPRGNVEAVLRQMEALLAAPVDESPFVAMAADAPGGLAERMRMLETSAIRPAIARYRDFLREEYLPAARTAVGVDANPQGEECYRAAVRYHATLDLTGEEIHRIGLEQMEAIHEEIRAIAARVFGGGEPTEVLARLRDEPRYWFESREQMLATARAAVERAAAAAPRWFGRVPRADVVVQPFPAFSEASAPGGLYNPPADDGSRPGIYYINLYEAERTSRAGLEATAFHETYPGHHLQVGLALEREELHDVTRYLYSSGFAEGWGLYAERLADEMGLYSSDVDRLGLLSNEAMRAARLVVDSGLHALGWTRRQAIDYMLANTAESEASVAAEVDRYIAVPGQATAYMLGNLEIRRLRAAAEAALGDAFDVRAFHDAVLEDGAVPLSMLRRKMERWIAAQADGGR
ncbi:MAG TPA: DUF885 domain-containing protein [Gammaproteobacteria bacterium]